MALAYLEYFELFWECVQSGVAKVEKTPVPSGTGVGAAMIVRDSLLVNAYFLALPWLAPVSILKRKRPPLAGRACAAKIAPWRRSL